MVGIVGGPSALPRVAINLGLVGVGLTPPTQVVFGCFDLSCGAKDRAVEGLAVPLSSLLPLLQV